MENFLDLPSLLGLSTLSIPLLYAAAACLSRNTRCFTIAWRAACGAFVCAGVATLGWLLAEPHTPQVMDPLHVLGIPFRVRFDALTGLILCMVCFLAVILVRFSRTYLQGERNPHGYVRWFMATLAMAACLVISNNLFVIALAWVGTSFTLHPLLTFYQERPQALIAAHKKFLISRMADMCLFPALGLLAWEVGSLELDKIQAWAEAVPSLPGSIHFAAVLLGLSAAIKCAQLPFHGWLMQVMEAPTPVSALLHAGVVNIGGFVLIRVAPLMLKAPLAQILLVTMGSLTLVLASLVMLTRVTVKVMLAWSTCAQMGLMLVQCGLGAYSLAMLHLLAHSLYKANAFLSAGSTVERWQASALAPSTPKEGLAAWGLATFFSLCAVLSVLTVSGVHPSQDPPLWVFLTLLTFALIPLLLRDTGTGGRGAFRKALYGVALTGLYLVWHALFATLFPDSEVHGAQGFCLALAWGSVGMLFLLQLSLQLSPEGRVARGLYPMLFAGFSLDERFTRLTFRLWPPRSRTHTNP